MTSKKKIAASAVAVGSAAILALGGTFAWQSISQEALNEAMDTINPGGRLHDDFNGQNKDVYVENFTEDGTAIFARVRLDEYMEIAVGDGAATPLVENTVRNNVETWITRKPGTVDMTEDTTFGAYWDWNMGGQTTYMPTFNMNKDSLDADINGTYAGGDTGTPYGDYVDYSLPQYAEGSDGETGDEIYDADTNDIDEPDPVEDVNIDTVADQIHYATDTLDGTVITMDEWLLLEEDARIGNFWVWDEDGWAYWAQPIESGEATGLLLDEIVHANPPSDSWYYGINVVGQFVTADDIGFLNGTGFYAADEGAIPTANAELLLETITGTDIPDATVSVSAADSATSVQKGGALQFSAAVNKGGNALEEPSVTWSLAGAADAPTTTIDASSGLLSVSENETAESLTVTATYMDGETECTGSFTVTVTEEAP